MYRYGKIRILHLNGAYTTGASISVQVVCTLDTIDYLDNALLTNTIYPGIFGYNNKLYLSCIYIKQNNVVTADYVPSGGAETAGNGRVWGVLVYLSKSY